MPHRAVSDSEGSAPTRFTRTRTRALALGLGLGSVALSACGTTRTMDPAGRPPGRQPPACSDTPAATEFLQSTRREQATAAARATAAKFPIIGWGDEQRLAVPKTILPGLKYGPLGRIIPVDTLERIPEASFDRGWVLVARIQVTGNYAKLGLGATSYDSAGSDASTNTLWICRQQSDRRWYARVVRPDRRRSYFPVDYDPHPSGPLPGAARWVWREDDETAWIMCPSGCCTLGAML